MTDGISIILDGKEILIEKLEDYYRSIEGIANVETKEVGLI